MARDLRRLAVLGAGGMLGQALCRVARRRGIEVTGVDLRGADVDLDIRRDDALAAFCAGRPFDCLVNTCAIVSHAFCDEHPAEAYLLNARPNAVLANLAREHGFKYVYVTTDGYFSGDGRARHAEDAPVTLLNEYARTKYAGEAFASRDPAALVTRTNIVGFRRDPERPTFVEWALGALRRAEPMTLFTDYFTSSISVAQYSEALLDLVAADASGTVNVASREVSSKAEFITALAEAFGLPLDHARTGSVASLTQSRRPDSLGLDVTKAETILGRRLPTLREVIAQLRSEA